MAVTTDKNKVEENGNGIKTNFEFSFELRENSHLKVYKYTIATKELVLQVETIDYIIPVPDLGQVGGSVEYTIAPTTEERSILIRELPYTQETVLPYDGNLPAKTLEYTYDNNTMLIQQLHEISNRTFKSGIGTNPGDIDFTLPPLVAKKAFIVDDTGTKVILSDDDYNDQLANVTAQADSANQSAQNAAAEVSRAQGFADDAETSATNASASEINAQTSASNASTSAGNALTSENNASTSATNAGLARDEAVTAKDDAETAQAGAEQAEQNVIDLLDQFPDLTATDTGRLGTVNEAGTGYDLLPSGTAGEVLTSNGPDTKPEYKPAPATVNVVDNLSSTSATDALSANQGRILNDFTTINSAAIVENAVDITSNTNLINTVDGKIGAVEAKADANTVRITAAETNIFNNSQAITANTSNITANTQILAKIPPTNPTDTGRLAIVNSTGDGYELLGTGSNGQVLTSSGPNAIPTFQNDSGGTIIIDDLLSTSAIDALSANQGRVLKGFTDTNASAITANTDLINRIPSTTTQDTGKLLAVDPNGAEFDLLNTGTSGQVLTSGGINTLPTFQDPPSGVGLSVNKIEVTQDFTVTLDEFDGGFDLVLLEVFGSAKIQINVTTGDFYALKGKSIIIQNMDISQFSIKFVGFNLITGYQDGDFTVLGATRVVVTLASNITDTSKVAFVDDQGSLSVINQHTAKLNYYPSNPTGISGRLFASNESGTAYGLIPSQGNTGDVLTSRGANLQPEFAPAELPPGTEKIKRITLGRDYTFLFSEFDDGSSAIVLECTGRFILTISTNGYTGDYSTLAGRLLIVQQMDDQLTDIRFVGFDNIEGSRKNNFNLRPSTRATMTLVTDIGATEKNIFIDDQEWVNYLEADHDKIILYPQPNSTIGGELLFVTESGFSVNSLTNNSDEGAVLTSRGPGLQPSFQPISLPDTEKVKTLETSVNATYNLSEFEPDFDALYIKSFNDAEITIDANYANYQDIVGKIVIIQVMDENIINIRLNNFNVIAGYYTNSTFPAYPYTRITLSILTKEDGTSRVVFIDDQRSVEQTKLNQEKLSKYVTPSAGLAGMLTAVNESGGAVSIIGDQGDVGEVLTSRGSGLLPSFQPAGGAGGAMELISITEASGQSFIDFVLPSGASSTYFFALEGINFNSTSEMNIKFSSNGGSTFREANTDYNHVFHGANSNRSVITNSSTTNRIPLQPFGLNNTGYFSGNIYLYSAQNNSQDTHLMFSVITKEDNSNEELLTLSGIGRSTQILNDNAIRFFSAGKTFNAGRILFYRQIN